MKIQFPVVVSSCGVISKIHKATQIHKGQVYRGFMVVYSLLGKRKRVWRSDLVEARTLVQDACTKIANGEHMALELRNGERMAYLRATEALVEVHAPVDTACREYADALKLLAGRASVLEVCRDWLKVNATELPKITVPDSPHS